jgi:hypothetical protein
MTELQRIVDSISREQVVPSRVLTSSVEFTSNPCNTTIVSDKSLVRNARAGFFKFLDVA